MDTGLRQEKSTGYLQLTATDSESVLAPVESTAEKSASPVLTIAPLKDVYLISTAEVSASKLLAMLVMMGDYKALKAALPESRLASSNGKIYWCAELPGHVLSLVEGKILVDGIAASTLLDKLLDVE